MVGDCYGAVTVGMMVWRPLRMERSVKCRCAPAGSHKTRVLGSAAVAMSSGALKSSRDVRSDICVDCLQLGLYPEGVRVRS
ncbi:hypothetical protein EVAR_68200_1 [Eumeta japonica]|uniref:Uncharacterized protein n=1 Tax=Eumeta variegata TaxID=151549 RepID=A0A4C2A5Z6_EUMVA|nr:hypothetical protein EVAR_68200_1 [Eumeta japonica]